ncbi:MAG: oligosaccharide flippase family protein [Solirubrobacterales bacterium]|nr:oligosaccharide flippase family protein [Solirubrobacterales bacterium]
MSDDLRGQVARGLVSMGVRTVVVRLLGLAGTLVLARQLGPSEYGVLALGLSIVILSKFLSDGGLAPGLLRREEPPERAELEAVYAVQVAICLLILGGVAAATFAFVGGDHAIALTLFAATPALDAARTPTVITLERDLAFGLVIRAEIAEIFLYNLLAVGLVVAGMGLVGVGIAVVTKSIVGTAILVVRGPVGLVTPRPSWSRLRSLLRFGAAFQGAWLLTIARDQGLELLLASLAGTAALGAWALAKRLLIVLTLLVEASWRVALPGFSRLVQAGEDPRRLLQRGLSLAGVACGFPVVALVGSTPVLVPLLFGDAWGDTQDVLPLVAAGLMLAIPVGLVLNSLLWAQDQAGRAFVMGIPGVVVTLAVAVPLMPSMGAVGAGIGTLAGALAFVAAGAWIAKDELGARALLGLAGPVASSAAGVAAGWLVAEELGDNAVALLGAAVTGTVVYVAALAVLDRGALERLVGLARRARPQPAAAN